MMTYVLEGLFQVLDISVFFWIIIGIVIGTIVGALPGLTAAMAVALLSPVTFFVSPLLGVPFLIAIAKGAMFGGSISAILVGIPGTPAASATIADGHALAREGRAREALEMALAASVAGDTSSDLIAMFVAAPVAALALMFGPPEYFAVILFSLILVGALTGESVIKGLLSALFGLFIGTIGMDPLRGVSRFSFGSLNLTAGISLIPVLIGLFAISQVLLLAEDPSFVLLDKDVKTMGNKGISRKDILKCLSPIAKGTVIGSSIGILPGIGATIAAFITHGIHGLTTQDPKYGKGSLEGVAAAESANNACNGASMIPLVTFGIPGDTITAVVMATFIAHGLSPGPLMFQQQTSLIYGIFWALIISNFFMFLVGFISLRFVAQIVQIPYKTIITITCGLSIVGTYAVNYSFFDISLMAVFGMIGYIMQKLKFPLAPLVIGLILQRLLEETLGSTLTLFSGSYHLIALRPIAVFFLISSVILVIIFIRVKQKLKEKIDKVDSF